MAGQHCTWICSIFSTTPQCKILLLSSNKGEVRQREFGQQASHPASKQWNHAQGGVYVQCLARSGPSESGNCYYSQEGEERTEAWATRPRALFLLTGSISCCLPPSTPDLSGVGIWERLPGLWERDTQISSCPLCFLTSLHP